ncbi:4-hydroxythreonine-4-phosphate dehydrogenase PdxA [Orrella marina]|uniref:4-hydroxythreonine-4-phosphate dehydrogenase PdxA n=1 Tax=Orrella marina TaxID=2163011 RepID=A0A2R4XFL1_9BURK|nr:4-hydroxythreonine-4-phosphate dehydrogenase PdxA [Orrella marina]AWB32607.1 4-hydroxythreonine-4-phosphate dehydrogenase PdxA [Orrella marina]
MTSPVHSLNAPIGITMGDPAGIGPEIVLKLLTGHGESSRGKEDTYSESTGSGDAKRLAQCVVYGDAGALRRTAARLGIDCHIETIDHAQVAGRITSPSPSAESVPEVPVIRVIQTYQVPETLVIGKVSKQAGRSAYESVSRAIDDALAGHIRAMVTAPLNKVSIGLAGIEFPGHTEILAARSGDVPVAMMLANPVLRVILVTIHVPLRDVPDLISVQAELQTIEMAALACRQLGIARPRIAVAGLNPHAGENGKFGDEEQQVIEPAIQAARERGWDVSGPWPGDTIFARARQGEFDIVVAQYHDQGLIPVKYLGLDEGVNVTVGLPFVRTSVDHGTAFDIAGKGIASPESLRSALNMADQLSRNAMI